MKTHYIIFLYTYFTVFGLFSLPLFGQTKSDTLNYDLFVNDAIIGEMYVIKNIKSDGSYNYVAKSTADYRLIFMFHIQFSYLTSFNPKGEYLSSNFTYLLNENVKESNEVRRVENKCTVYEEGKIKKVIETPVHTSMEMYFKEPLGLSWVFSERYNDYVEIEKERVDIYKIDFPGGCTNHYYYKNGKCYKVKINTLISDMEFRLRTKPQPLFTGK